MVIVLRFFVGEGEVERDLVGLVHDGPMAGDHPADLELEHAGDVAQIFFRAGGQSVSGAGLSGIGPEDDDVTEFSFNLRLIRFHILNAIL